mgnify:CR=1 FL=1|jgi:hypothetical protein
MSVLNSARDGVALKLQRLASGCSLRAGQELHYLNDNLEPWLETNEDIDEYLRLLDVLALLR